MPRKSRVLVLLFAVLLPLAAQAAPSTAPRKTLRPFASEQELKALFDQWAEEARRRPEGRRSFGAMADAPASAPQAAMAKAAEAASADSVTNVQHAGVDEGGIVKVHGDHLVILRRGRLFTVKIGDNALKPVDAVDAFAPGVN